MTEFNFIRDTIYSLKRQFPKEVTFRKLGVPQINLSTGVSTTPTTEVTIRRAILFPKGTEFIKSSGQIVQSNRVIMIDRRDLPNDVFIDSQDKVVIDGKEWDISKIESVFDIAFQIVLKEVEGS